MSHILREGRENWYRNTHWSVAIEIAFLAKLKRTRGQGPQYLAIQIGHLVDTNPKDALRLADMYFDDWSDPFHDGQVHMSKARAYEVLDQLEKAAASYEDAIAWQRYTPNHIIGAELAYGLLVAENGLENRLNTAKQAVSRIAINELRFPLERFRYFAVTSLFASMEQDDAAAQRDAALALTEADRRTSGFRFHPKLGLVSTVSTPLIARLKRLARIEK